MDKQEKEKYVQSALREVYEHLVRDLHYNIFYLCVQGSTNYNLDIYTEEYHSDIDMKCFVIPTVEDLYYNKKISTTLTTSYGLVEVKDIRFLPELLGKMNLSYLELLYSQYFLTPFPQEVEKIRLLRDNLVEDRKPLFVKALYGTCMSKYDGLFHETEHNREILQKFGGYDPKQLHHALRLRHIAYWMFENNAPLEYALVPRGADHSLLIHVKVHGVGTDLTHVDTVCKSAVGYCKAVCDMFWENKQLRPGYVITDVSLQKISDIIFKTVMYNINK